MNRLSIDSPSLVIACQAPLQLPVGVLQNPFSDVVADESVDAGEEDAFHDEGVEDAENIGKER